MQMRINNSSRHQSPGILLLAILFFALQVVFDLNELYSKDKKSVNQTPDVSIHFEFDKRLEARPYRIFLKKEEEFSNNLEWNDPNRFQLYQTGQMTYDFYNIKPGIYWVGLSFRYLQKDWSVIEWEYIEPVIYTEGSKDTRNRIEVKKNKKVIVDLIIQVRLDKRPQGDADSSGYFRYVKRERPKSPEEATMMDENYFPYGMAVFLNVRRSCSKNSAHSEIGFLIYGFDDYQFDDSQPKENK